MNRTKLGCVGVAVGLVGAGVSMGAITSVAGTVTQIGAPTLANWPTLTGPLADAWDEQQSVTLPAGGVFVDMLVSGGTMSSTSPTPGVVTGIVDSHMLHWSVGPVPQATGTVTFNAPIEGVIYGDLLLDATDALLGAGGTTYPTGQVGRGMNFAGVLTATGNQLHFNFIHATGAIDIEQVRVLTRVPAPGGVCVGMLGLAAAMRRRR
ncbi:MAG: hypothetical protein AB7G17_12215 [Phycisphaerales bacterium]